VGLGVKVPDRVRVEECWTVDERLPVRLLVAVADLLMEVGVRLAVGVATSESEGEADFVGETGLTDAVQLEVDESEVPVYDSLREADEVRVLDGLGDDVPAKLPVGEGGDRL